ncbi:MAG: DUF368 domain-containing protein [Flavobacteriaceae bacterium]|uniref:DUF368 domain-containing protein n=1 Tax=Bizionia echini TaxID=649333 RepID=UPI000C8A103E|nr:DUF368 domain-containing protein [Flavobacteriaceae bacterium]
MQRRLSDYLLISLKGIAMGAADAVPGVSGGTIAFISGIYEELITTISNVNLGLFKTLKTSGFTAFWKALNGNFLVALLLGIIVSFVSFMRLAKYLIEYHPVLIWSFFFGLIIASIYFVGKQINKWHLPTVLALITGTVIAFYITTLPSSAGNESPYFLFIAGAIAICAMILPGISGSFILLILGAYKTLSDAFHDFDLKRIALFAGGALVGLLSFSHVLKWLFKNYHNVTLALLTGFIFGSLNKVWPWKLTDLVMEKSSGLILPLSDITTLGNLTIYQQELADFDSLKVISETSILPNMYAIQNNGLDPQLVPAIILMLVGFFTIFILERFGKKVQ